MLKAFFTSATGMRAQELLIDNTANNLANVNTTGFKKSHVEFADLVYDVTKQPGASSSDAVISPIGLQVGNGVRAVGTTNVFTQGAVTETGVETHMAIEGDGYFRVLLPDGEPAYTRDGSFTRNADGNLTSAGGYLLDPAIAIPAEAEDINISENGIVEVFIQGDIQEVGRITLTRFPNKAGLKQLGGNLLQETPASGAAEELNAGEQGVGTIRARHLEGSNVQVVAEMVSLITAQRAYEINSRAIRAGDEMLSNTSQIVR